MHTLVFGIGSIIIFITFYSLWIISSPFFKIWESIWHNPEKASKQVIGIVASVMLIMFFEIPFAFNLGIQIGGRIFDITIHAFVNLIATLGPFFGTLLIFVLWFAIPLTFILAIVRSLLFFRDNPAFFARNMLLAFVMAYVGYCKTGYVVIEFAFYGIGAIIIWFCLKFISDV